MKEITTSAEKIERLSIFQRYLTLWVLLCILAGIVLGRLFPGVAVALDAMSISQVSIPIAICLFFMMYPIMVKIDRESMRRKPLALDMG